MQHLLRAVVQVRTRANMNPATKPRPQLTGAVRSLQAQRQRLRPCLLLLVRSCHIAACGPAPTVHAEPQVVHATAVQHRLVQAWQQLLITISIHFPLSATAECFFCDACDAFPAPFTHLRCCPSAPPHRLPCGCHCTPYRCIHRAMDPQRPSRCPMCRSTYMHLPRVSPAASNTTAAELPPLTHAAVRHGSSCMHTPPLLGMPPGDNWTRQPECLRCIPDPLSPALTPLPASVTRRPAICSTPWCLHCSPRRQHSGSRR